MTDSVNKILLVFLLFYFIAIKCFANQGILSDSLSDSSFATLSEALSSPESVKYLDISEQGLTKIDLEIDTFPNLIALSINDEEITTIPKSIFKSENLRFLALANNDSLKEFDNEVFNMKSLEELWLSGTPIKIKDVIKTNNTLKILWIAGCDLFELPESFSNLIALKELQIYGNNFKDIPESIFNLQSIEVLNLSACPLTSIDPKKFKQLKKLRKLRLVSTNIKEDDIKKVSKYLPAGCEFVYKFP